MKKWLRWGFLALAAALLAWAVAKEWDDVTAALAALSWGTILAAGLAATIALGVNALSWREVMVSVGLTASVPSALRVFLLSQVGKYVPGSVWPVLAQAEFARDHGVSRARAMTGSIVAMIVGVVTAALVGLTGAALTVPDAVATYWWVLPVALGLVALLTPPVLSRVVALAFRVTKRTEDPVHISGRALAASAGWSVLMWLLLGLQAWLLLREIAPGEKSTYILATGAFALAWLVGFLVVIAPAGAGVREAALVVLLASVATQAQALSLALVSRFVMTAADAIGFAAGVAIGRGRPASEPDRTAAS
ncbi:lysylphosphatidylglycerol synthase domain-containing protein [Demequina sp.]|uniref:lysylphosphatidylglycerol synthase domain-containing protein n=1 Tax=Demequina sp. TaxID=2050685 RepID=UPI003D0B7643